MRRPRGDPAHRRRTESGRSRRRDSRTGGTHETPARRTSEAPRHPARTLRAPGRSRNGPGRPRTARWRWDRRARSASMAAPRAGDRRFSCHLRPPVNPEGLCHVGEQVAAIDHCGCRPSRVDVGGICLSRPSFLLHLRGRRNRCVQPQLPASRLTIPAIAKSSFGTARRPGSRAAGPPSAVEGTLESAEPRVDNHMAMAGVLPRVTARARSRA
jgi:hypothetical protein